MSDADQVTLDRDDLPQETAADLYDDQALEVIGAFFDDCKDIGALRSKLGRMIASIDERLSLQLSQVIEAKPFKSLEASWRGLEAVVISVDAGASVKLKIFDLGWDELSHDMNTASDLRRTVLFKQIRMRELETAGGEPFGIVLIDHGLSMDLDGDFDDLYTAQLICDLAESCVCPFILGIGEDFFGEADAAWMTDTRRISAVLSSRDYEAWHRLRNRPNARFLGLVFPETLLRGRHQDLDIGFRFHQWPSQSTGLWGNAGYAFLRTVIAEYQRCAWFGFLKLIGETAGMGAVLAKQFGERGRYRFTLGTGQFYSEQGFIPLCESGKSHDLYFVGNRSVTDCKDNPVLEVLTQLQSVLIACRVVHYIKVQIRALIGQIKTASECQLILNNWLDNYCSNVAEAAPDVLARYPLREARVQVNDASGYDARFSCEIYIRPQYQIDHMMSDIKLATEFGSDKEGAGS